MFRAELRLIEYPGNAPYSVLFEGGKGGLAIMHHDDFSINHASQKTFLTNYMHVT